MTSLETSDPTHIPNGTGHGVAVNGVSGNAANGANNFSLTEYSAMPSPPSEEPLKSKLKIPNEFLLPDGTPDVGAH